MERYTKEQLSNHWYYRKDRKDVPLREVAESVNVHLAHPICTYPFSVFALYRAAWLRFGFRKIDIINEIGLMTIEEMDAENEKEPFSDSDEITIS